MANTSSTIKIVFAGTARGVVAAATAAKSAIKGLTDENKDLEKVGDKIGTVFTGLTKGLAGLGAAGSAVQVIGGVAGAMAQLAPAALLLPGALLAGGAAMGTFTIATAGMGDALKAGLSGDMAKFAKATKDMAPAMQDAAKAVTGLKPQIDDLKKTVQGNFWAGFAGDITKIGNTYLPILKAGMGGIASEFNLAGKQVLAFLQSAQAVGSINNVLNKTRDTFGNMRGALTNVVSGFLQLANVGVNFLPRLGTAIQSVSEKFAAWVQDAAFSGRLEDMINGAIQGFKDLGAIVGNIGSILGSVFTGLGGSISSPLASLRELTGQLAAFLKTAEAQDGLRSLGEVLSTAASVMRDVMMAALREIAPLLVDLGPAAKAVAQGVGDFLVGAIKVAGPLLQGMARFLSDNADTIRAVIPLVLTVAAGIKGLLIAQTVVAGVRALGAAFAFLGSKAGLWAAAIVAATDVAIGAIKGYSQAQEEAFTKGGFGDDINTFVKDFKVEPLQAIGKEIRASLTPPAETQGLWQRIAQSFQTDFIDVMAAAPGKVKESFQTDFLDVFAALPGKIGGFLSGLGSSISTATSSAWQSFVDTTRTKIDEAITFVSGLPGRVIAAVGEFGSSLAAKASEAWESFRSAALAKFDAIDGDAKTLPGRIGFAIGSLIGMAAKWAIDTWESFKTSAAAKLTEIVADVAALPGRIGAAISSLASSLMQKATQAWQSWRQAAAAKSSEIEADARAFPGKVIAAISSLVSSLAAKASEAWQSFKASAIAKGNEIIADARALPGKIVASLAALAGLLTSSATNAANGFRNGLVNGFNAAVGFVRGIPGMIVSALSSLGSALVSIGSAAMNGLLRGLASGASAITSWARNFVAGLVAGMKASLGIASPSRVFRDQIGKQIGAGLIAGLDASRSGVIASAQELANAASSITVTAPSVSAPTPQQLSLSAPDSTAATLRQLLSLQTQQTPVEVTVLLDGQPVRDIARTEITTTSRATRRTVGMGAGTTF